MLNLKMEFLYYPVHEHNQHTEVKNDKKFHVVNFQNFRNNFQISLGIHCNTLKITAVELQCRAK